MGSSSQPAPGEVKPIPAGMHSVTVYITSRQPNGLIEFVKQAFGAVEILRMQAAQGLHAEVRIGDSVLMIGGGDAMHSAPLPTALHLYVPDADAVYRRALEAGAASLREPVDQTYNDREASVRDKFGNHWYIATRRGANPVPEGLRTLTPYLHPRDTAQFIEFLKHAFDGAEVERHASAHGAIVHAKVRIGDSMLEMSDAHDNWQPMPTMFYLYVEDCDAAYQSAVEAGAASLEAPADQPYGDRRAGVKDRWENLWYIATHVRDIPSP